MFSEEFVRLAEDRPELQQILDRIRELSSSMGDSSALRTEVMASLLNAPHDFVRCALDEIVRLGELQMDSVLECSACKNRFSKDHLYCTQCLAPIQNCEEVIQYTINASQASGEENETILNHSNTHKETLQTPQSTLTPPLMTWIHLSDLHCGHPNPKHKWDQSLVLGRLLNDLEELVIKKEVPPPEYVFITGDIAFSGNQNSTNEYELADAFIQDLAKRLTISPDKIFTIPGNHDVQRMHGSDALNTNRLLRVLRDGSEELDSALSAQSDRALLSERHRQYLNFAKKYAPYNSMNGAEDAFDCWQSYIPLKDLQLKLIGFNTAILSFDDKDKGVLRLGTAALSKSLKDLNDDLVIVLSHHPFFEGWLADQTECRRWIDSSAHIHLNGHIHEGDSEESRRGAGRRTVRISAGAVHGDKQPTNVPAGHGYNISSLYRTSSGTLNLRIWTRKWSDRQKRFVQDSDATPKNQAYAEHDIELSR